MLIVYESKDSGDFKFTFGIKHIVDENCYFQLEEVNVEKNF